VQSYFSQQSWDLNLSIYFNWLLGRMVYFTFYLFSRRQPISTKSWPHDAVMTSLCLCPRGRYLATFPAGACYFYSVFVVFLPPSGPMTDMVTKWPHCHRLCCFGLWHCVLMRIVSDVLEELAPSSSGPRVLQSFCLVIRICPHNSTSTHQRLRNKYSDITQVHQICLLKMTAQ
jgi:hypothetical protein